MEGREGWKALCVQTASATGVPGDFGGGCGGCGGPEANPSPGAYNTIPPKIWT